ncbi:hypothetical protein A9404_07880 [Halothiobacillus diazotrophicus]|uniref:Uncharacterized protein n=1 Tax=Halothiobacillus diazotrophicus TaxID=1860122 RepID=A0A191ZHI7_9GAMM|nr:hypothetical protein [Halothiobacillus diazotrophicus]ANJ67313.1 hypothetical protein A9404_07880 [Halothiobacillus diazotrophicus]
MQDMTAMNLKALQVLVEPTSRDVFTHQIAMPIINAILDGTPVGIERKAAATAMAKGEETLKQVDKGATVVGKGIPGIDKPFRAANSAYPPSASLVDQMNSMKLCAGTDCSEIAEKLFNAAGGNGKILRVTGKGGGDINLLEHGRVDGPFKYHEVFTDGRYVYDPRLSGSPVPKGDWEQMIRGLNPGAKIK